MNDFENTEKIYTPGDLHAWHRDGPSFAVLGRPIAHSLSPKMQNRALAEIKARFGGISRTAKYFRFEIAPEQLGETLPLFLEKNFAGLNLTIPHKVAALPFLAELSPEAKRIGAANTLAVAVTGTARNGAPELAWRGENTDGRGFARAAKMLLGRDLAGANIVLLGAGGAARAIAATALAEGCASLTVVNRSRERRDALEAALKKHFPDAAEKIASRAPFSADETNALPDAALVVNATPLGLAPGDASPLPPKILRDDCAVYDTTYAAAHTSALVSAARERRLPAADGRAMLAWQGALALEIWLRGSCIPAETVFPWMFEEICPRSA